MIGIIITVAVLCIAVAVVSYICFRLAFYVDRSKQKGEDEIDLPEGEIYEVYYDKMIAWTKEIRKMPYEDMEITTFDGLKLHARYYEYSKDAPVELMFHGYRGNAERDLSGGVQRCFSLGRSAFIVDQRCSGKSEGNVITFGIKEHRDCLCWVDFMIKRFGQDVKIILCGISMGASTVLMASGKELPENVIGVLADCGFNSAKDIIHTVIKKMGLPPKLAYPFVKLGARLYGHFDIDETSAEKAVKNCKVPVIFYHGDTDDFVPCEMSKINYEACPTRKKLVLIKNAGHGLSYLKDPKTYLDTLRDFFNT